MTVPSKPNFRYDIAILRLLAITIVVFFHGYGMTYAHHLSEATTTTYHTAYQWFNQFYPINIGMPLFVFISGFLFGGSRIANEKFSTFIKNKASRILLPFFIFMVFFMLTTNSFAWNQFYKWTYWHLWFLPMLFWCFILCYFLNPLIRSKSPYKYLPVLLISFAISWFPRFVPNILGLSGVSVWACWFFIGSWFNKNEHKILRTKQLKWLYLIIGTTIYLILSILYPLEYDNTSIPGTLASLSAIMALWSFCNLIPWKNFKFTDFLLSLSACSFGVYIFHNWIEMHMLSRTAQRLLPIEQWAHDHVILFPLIFVLIAYAISIVITKLFLKTKIGRLLIG